MYTSKINLIESIVGNLSVDLKKLFDKGDITTLYMKMYKVADKLSIAEAERYKGFKGIEFHWKTIVNIVMVTNPRV